MAFNPFILHHRVRFGKQCNGLFRAPVDAPVAQHAPVLRHGGFFSHFQIFYRTEPCAQTAPNASVLIDPDPVLIPSKHKQPVPQPLHKISQQKAQRPLSVSDSTAVLDPAGTFIHLPVGLSQLPLHRLPVLDANQRGKIDVARHVDMEGGHVPTCFPAHHPVGQRTAVAGKQILRCQRDQVLTRKHGLVFPQKVPHRQRHIAAVDRMGHKNGIESVGSHRKIHPLLDAVHLAAFKV